MDDESRKLSDSEGKLTSDANTRELRMLDRILTCLMVVLLSISLFTWCLKGTVLYDGEIFYVSDTKYPTLSDDIRFTHLDGNSYEAKLFGIFPVGTVQIIPQERRTVYLGTDCVLINTHVDGWLVLSYWDEDCDMAKKGIVAGDIITHINGIKLTADMELGDCTNGTGTELVTLTVSRNGTTFTVECYTREDGKLGVTSRMSSFVLGTTSFVDEDGFATAIGHNLGELFTLEGSELVPVYAGVIDGSFTPSEVLSENTAKVISGNKYGIVYRPCEDWSFGDAIEIAWSWEIRHGNAEVRIVNADGSITSVPVTISSFNGELVNEDMSSSSLQYRYQLKSKNDFKFISGMSGSPIIQNGRLIGVLAASNVEDPSYGYFISAELIYANLFNVKEALQ